ncbi:phosphodiesterase [Treponema phagedenis]|uniref:phosphodiesterase n=1 Tax=Treponema phagedenis TaxID=162 RepID=UPI00197F5B23|nr:phosphodiesterase [Treponema phagedenis]QSH99394.1 phosphodiesterase [Treponema phagedenis]
MRIGILSDTHGGYEDVLKALEVIGKVDHIIHLGDVLYHGPRNDLPPTYNPKALAELFKNMENISFIRGNCDADVDEMVTKKNIKDKNRLYNFDGFKIFALHGYEETLEERVAMAKKLGADMVAFGHSHVKMLETIDGIIVLNPGSTTIPKDGSKSAAIIEDGKARLLEF